MQIIERFDAESLNEAWLYVLAHYEGILKEVNWVSVKPVKLPGKNNWGVARIDIRKE